MNRFLQFTAHRRAVTAVALLLSASFSPAQAPAFSTLAEFTGSNGTTGSRPVSELMQASDGDFYGTTLRGGTADLGSVYKITAGGTFTPLRSFTGAAQPTGGLYPVAGLAEHTDGMLYGTTSGDFTAGSFGIAYKMSASGGTFTNFLFFKGQQVNDKGSTPLGTMTKASDGFFYGTTQYGGTGTVNFGTIYKINPTTGILTTVIEFTDNGANNKGAAPNAKLVDGGDGYLYGTTYGGGTLNIGTVFRLRVSNGSLSTLATFTNASSPNPGKWPIGAMVLASDGYLYGTTVNGGAFNAGVIYRVNRTTGTVTTIVEFNDNAGVKQGAWPVGAMVQGNDGFLYGTTQNGGTGDHGTIFRVSLGGVLTPKLLEFTGQTGAVKGEGPYAGMLKATDGRIYGTTQFGGSGNKGTVFRLTLPAVVVTGAATSVTATTATLNGTVNPLGMPTTYQFEYGTTTSYGSSKPLVPANTGGGNGVESVNASLTGLTAGTLYHFRLKAISAGGTVTGSDATFTTPGGSQPAPTVVTSAATAVLNSSATLNGTVNPNGAVSLWQFEYGPTTSYGSVIPVSPGVTGAGSSAESVSTSVTGLPPGTLIHYRLTATNSGGTNTGSDATFTTTGSPQPPIVVTGAATDIGGTSAVLNGTVNPRGSATTWQFEYGSDLSFGSVIPLTPGDAGNGIIAQPVNITLSGLTPGSTVFFRLTATSAVNPVTGSNGQFTTLFPPDAITLAAVGVTKTNATLTGTVNPRGATTTWQFEYGPDTSYGSFAPVLAGTTGTGNSPESVSTTLTSLPAGSTWHYRLVATSSAGTDYGDDLTFTTRQPPTVATGSVINLTATGATLQGTVNPQGFTTTWQFDYGTTIAYGQSLPLPPGNAGAGSTPQAVSTALTSLLPNTTYHYSLRATSTHGTSTTADATFTTPNNISGWRLQHFGTMNNTGNAANTADPDADGVINQLEYGFGMNPNVRDPQLVPIPSYNGSVLIASFTAPAGVNDVTYAAEVSTNLLNWSPIADSGSGLAHTFAAPFSSTGRNWMRLKVILQP